jgi:hypothetical protein
VNRAAANGEGDGIVARLRETADGLGQLISDHVKLARIELSAEARAYGRDFGGLAAAVAVLAVGYVFGWIAAALALSHLIGAELAFGSVALLHFIGGGLATGAVIRRIRRVRVLEETASEVARSVGALSHPLAPRGISPGSSS